MQVLHRGDRYCRSQRSPEGEERRLIQPLPYSWALGASGQPIHLDPPLLNLNDSVQVKPSDIHWAYKGHLTQILLPDDKSIQCLQHIIFLLY